MKRYKSREVCALNIGDIVLLKKGYLPLIPWLINRVLQKQPADDGIARV